jgi:hypothetical protein
MFADSYELATLVRVFFFVLSLSLQHASPPAPKNKSEIHVCLSFCNFFLMLEEARPCDFAESGLSHVPLSWSMATGVTDQFQTFLGTNF